MTPARAIRRAAAMLLTAAVILSGCTATNPSSNTGTMGVMVTLPGIIVPIGGSPVDTVNLRVEPAGGGESTEYELDVIDNSASTTIDVFPGTWTLEAEVYKADETLVATGTGMAVVLPGTVTEVNMHLDIINGALDIDIEWDESPPLFVADVSHRPVWVEIGEFGDFWVSGLSRIGWDIEVLEFPATIGHTIKEPGEVSYPELAMLYLRSIPSEVANLTDWINDPNANPRSMSIILEGLAGESTRINFYEVTVVSANTETFAVGYNGDVEMGGIRVQYDHFEMDGYLPTYREVPYEWTLPNPGLDVEFQIFADRKAYENGAIDVPVPGDNPALWFHDLYRGDTFYDWAHSALDVLDGFNSVERSTMSIINVGVDGLEIDRINIFEIWPASINVFNPEKPYGQTYLIDIFVVGERVEEG